MGYEKMISVLVPTMGNPWHLETTVRTLVENAVGGPHEILVFSNEHTSETDDVIRRMQAREWPVRLVGSSDRNEGVSIAVNACAAEAKGEFLFYTGDDYYFMPRWDAALLRRVKIGEWQYLTSRSIEPTGTNSVMYAPHPFGFKEDDFREKDLLAFWKSLPKRDVISCAGPPFAARWIWEKVGGFDLGYWPGFGTDPDLAMKIYQAAKADGKEASYLGVATVATIIFK